LLFKWIETDKIITSGKKYSAATSRSSGVDRFVNGCRVDFLSVALCAEFADIKHMLPDGHRFKCRDGSRIAV